MTTDTFIRDRFAWLDQILADPATTGADLQVAYILSTRFIHREKGFAWMAVETITAIDGRSARRVRQSLTRLKARGHLKVARRGRGNTSQYWMQRTSTQQAPRLDENVHSNEVMTGQNRPLKADEWTKASSMSGRKRPPTSFEEPFEEDIRPTGATLISFPEPSKKREEPDNGFDSFWAIYPRKDSKGRARPAFASALKKVPLETILAGTKQYAAERMGKDAQYTKLPATWLNGECWSDQTLGMAETALQNAYADSSGWTRDKFVDVIALAKRAKAWFPAYGDPANIPSDLIDAELQAILDRLRTTSQIVA